MIESDSLDHNTLDHNTLDHITLDHITLDHITLDSDDVQLAFRLTLESSFETVQTIESLKKIITKTDTVIIQLNFSNMLIK